MFLKPPQLPPSSSSSSFSSYPLLIACLWHLNCRVLASFPQGIMILSSFDSIVCVCVCFFLKKMLVFCLTYCLFLSNFSVGFVIFIEIRVFILWVCHYYPGFFLYFFYLLVMFDCWANWGSGRRSLEILNGYCVSGWIIYIYISLLQSVASFFNHVPFSVYID